MSSNTSQSNEEYLQKFAALQTFILDIVTAETFEEVVKHVFNAIDATIDPIFKLVCQVRFGALWGYYIKKGDRMGFLAEGAEGMPLDGPGIIVRAVNTRKICNVPDTRKDPSYVEAFGPHSTLSEIAVPILVQGKSIGVVNIEEVETNAFNEADQKILEALAGYAGVSLNNIMYSNRLNGLHRYTSQLNTVTSLDEVAEHALNAMTDALELESCAFLQKQGDLFQTLSEKGLVESIRLREKARQWHTEPERWREANDIEFLSELEALINIESEVVAILSAKSIQPDKYTVQDKQLLEILANHVASASQRIRLLEEQAQYETKLEALHASASKLLYTESIEDICKFISAQAQSDIFEYEYVQLGYIQDKKIYFFYHTEDEQKSKGKLEEYVIDLKEKTIITRAVKTGKIQDIPETDLDPDFLCTVFDDNGLPLIKSEYTIPIINSGEVVAVLNAESTRLDAFSEQHKKLLEILANHVSSAIQRIRLLEEQLNYEAKLKALHASAARLVNSNSVEDICRVTYEIIRDIFDYEWVGVGFIQDKTIRFPYATGNVQVLDSSIWYSLGDAPIEFSYNIDTDKTVITRAVKTGEIQDLPDTRLDPDYKSAGLVEGGEPVLKSEYAIPIIHSGEVVAVLNAECTKLNAFSEQDKRLLETLANNISAVLMRLKVAEERERIQQELALEHIRVEQANELDRMKNQFISTATHELRTPVTSIIGFLELVLDYSSEELPESVRQDLNVVFRNAMRLVDMTNDLLDVQRISSGRFSVTLEKVEFIKTLNEVVEELKPLFTDKRQTLLVHSPSEFMVNIDETRISQLIINLLRNANKFTPEEGIIEVTVETIDSYVQVCVKDSGIGLSEEDIDKLFKPFPEIQHGINVSSTGLGLAICKGIVDLHKGEIWADSKGKGMGSTFYVRIPVNH